MRALVWDGKAARVAADRAAPASAEGVALVRVGLAGICDTDLQITRGYMNFRGVLGHEFVGVVAEGPPEWAGKRVAAEINFACGECPSCKSGLRRHCPARRVMGIQGADGAFAEFIAVPVANLHAVPEEVSDEAAVFTEPLAAAFEIIEQVPDVAGRNTVVLGDGKLGLLVAQVLAHAGADVLAVGKHDGKLAILRRCGIRTSTLKEWKREPVDFAVEATGTAAGFELALAAVRPRGTLVLKSTMADRVLLNLAPLVIDEIELIGSRCGPFEPALAALAAGDIETTSLISERVPLTAGLDALQLAARPGVLKVLLDPAAGG